MDCLLTACVFDRCTHTGTCDVTPLIVSKEAFLLLEHIYGPMAPFKLTDILCKMSQCISNMPLTTTDHSGLWKMEIYGSYVRPCWAVLLGPMWLERMPAKTITIMCQLLATYLQVICGLHTLFADKSMCQVWAFESESLVTWYRCSANLNSSHKTKPHPKPACKIVPSY